MFEGDLEELERLQAKLESAPEILKKAGERAAEALGERLDLQYERGVDPTDAPWKPVTERTLQQRKVKKSPPPLTDTRLMRSNSKAVSGVSGIRVSVTRPGKNPNVPAIQQKTRNIVPEGSSLPGPWAKAVETAVEEVVREHFEE